MTQGSAARRPSLACISLSCVLLVFFLFNAKIITFANSSRRPRLANEDTLSESVSESYSPSQTCSLGQRAGSGSGEQVPGLTMGGCEKCELVYSKITEHILSPAGGSKEEG